MGWGERQGPSAAMVAHREVVAAARAVVGDASSENVDRLSAALTAYDRTDPAVPAPGAYC